MIEVIYKEEKIQDEGEIRFRIPRNIRQIGIVNDAYRIYMEDYVYTFLGRLAKKQEEGEGGPPYLAVFAGETKWTEKAVYVFITGAVLAKEMEVSEEHIDFQESHWQNIHEQMGKYFPGQEITGWYFSGSGLPEEAPEVFAKAHLKYFGGEKVLMLLNPSEHEEAFYRFENNRLMKQSGYYIFYERNESMQTYMLDSDLFPQEEKTEAIKDEAVRSFRKRIREKKKEIPEETEGNASVFSYAATACLVIAVLAVGTNLYQNYKDIQNMGSQVQETASSLVEQENQKAAVGTVTAVPTPTPTPDPRISSKPASVPTQAAAETVSDTEVMQETDSGNAYKEESDIRKAKRREAMEAKEAEQTERAEETSAGTSYVVRPGDTLYEISMEKYGNTDMVGQICQINGISEEEMIYPGQIIVLP